MKSNLKLLLKSLFKKKTIIYVCIPMACCFVIALSINLLYSDMSKNKVIDDFSLKLDYAISQLDEIYVNSVVAINFLSEDTNVRKLLQDRNNSLSNTDFRELTGAVSTTFGNFIEIQNIYDDIILYLRRNDTIISHKGVYSANAFLNYLYRYSAYPKEFFDEFKIKPFRYRLLNITNISKGDYSPDDESVSSKQNAVIPFVWQDIEGYPNGGLIVMNIQMQKIINRLYSSDLPAEGRIFISDSLNNIYTIDGSDNLIAENIILKDLEQNKLHTETMFGKRYFVYSKRSEFAPFNSLTYTIYIDSDRIFASLHSFNQLMSMFMLFTFIITIVIIYVMINKLYSPLNMFFNQTNSYIENRGINADKNDFNPVNSVAQDYFFSHLLMWDNFYSHDSIDEILTDLKINIAHNNLIVVMINYLLTPEYDELFRDENNVILNRLNSIMTAILPENAVTYPIQLELNQLCIIVNCDNSTTSEVIKEIYKDFSESLTYDREYINIQVSISREKSTLEDLHKAYLEAKNSLLLLNPFQYNEVTVYGDHASFRNYNLSAKTEENLFSALTTKNKEKCREILRAIFEDNKSTVQPSFKSLCLRIYSICLKVLENRKIAPQAFMDEKYININIVIYELSPESSWRYINDFCEKLTDYNIKHFRTIEIDNVIEYIRENHMDSNLSLATLADYFDVTEKYISKFIVEKSGINFHAHLSRYRIENAKKLLQKSDIKVVDLMKQVGFANRNTFLRTFKKITGLTPSEYRELL